MSFSYGAVPEPESPPFKPTALAPAPVRSDRRQKRQTALSPSTLQGLGSLSLNDSLNDDPLDLDNGRRSESSLQQLATTLSREHGKRVSAIVIPVPKMISPLPPHYRHPSPAPSSVPSLSASSTQESNSACSLASRNSTRSRQSLVTKPSLSSLHHAGSGSGSDSDSLSGPCEPLTPTGATFSRSRGKSISRAVGKLASDFLNLSGKKNRSDTETVPAVPALPASANSRK